MKEIKRFTEGDQIPSNAVYIKSHYYVEADKLVGWYEVPVKQEGSKAATVNTHAKEIDEVINYLNQATGKRYSLKTEKTRKLIFKWIKAGYKVEQFKKAIDNKCSDWLGDPKWEVYLRPETLFGSKFEGYFNGHSANDENPFDELDNIMGGINVQND